MNVLISQYSNSIYKVADGEKLEKEMNETGPGETFFMSVDLTEESAIQVGERYTYCSDQLYRRLIGLIG